MKTININGESDSVVIHFETEDHTINAYTLASTLVALADAAKAANRILNPGYEIEIIVEALGPGSFRAQLRTIYTVTGNLFSSEVVRAIVLSVIGNFFYERTLAVKDDVKITVNTEEVIIIQGDRQVLIPRTIYDATRKVENNDSFTNAMAKMAASISADKNIAGMGFVENLESPSPEFIDALPPIETFNLNPDEEPKTRVITETVDLQIIKAILEKSKRKWEFVWRGNRISASITDENFYTNFFAHSITIAPGDTLQAILSIKQTKDQASGIYVNTEFEIIEVKNHAPRIVQQTLILGRNQE
jgi:hypothetical protein